MAVFYFPDAAGHFPESVVRSFVFETNCNKSALFFAFYIYFPPKYMI